jgi:hypothetical protein
LPLLFNFGTKWISDNVGWYIEKGLYSGRVETPGQVSSVGVPITLKIESLDTTNINRLIYLNILLNWSSTLSPGNKGFPPFANSANIHPADPWRKKDRMKILTKHLQISIEVV